MKESCNSVKFSDSFTETLFRDSFRYLHTTELVRYETRRHKVLMLRHLMVVPLVNYICERPASTYEFLYVSSVDGTASYISWWPNSSTVYRSVLLRANSTSNQAS